MKIKLKSIKSRHFYPQMGGLSSWKRHNSQLHGIPRWPGFKEPKNHKFPLFRGSGCRFGIGLMWDRMVHHSLVHGQSKLRMVHRYQVPGQSKLVDVKFFQAPGENMDRTVHIDNDPQ